MTAKETIISHNERLETLKSTVETLPDQVILPELTNPAAAHILNGYEAIDGEGEPITGMAGSGITKPATAAKISAGYQAMLADGTVLTGTSKATYAVLTGSGSLWTSWTVTAPGNIVAVAGYCSNGSYSGGTATPDLPVPMLRHYSSDVNTVNEGVMSFSGKVFTYEGSTSDGVRGDTVEYTIVYEV